jgi:hypothetical protein
MASNPNNRQNCDPIPTVSRGGTASPNSDSLLRNSLQGAGELGLAGVQASIAATSARSGDWGTAGIAAWEASNNAMNGVSHLAPGVGAAVSSYGNAMSQVDVHGERFDPYSDSNNSSTDPGLISWAFEKVGSVFQAYGKAMNQVDVYGERFDPYSDSNNFSIGDNSYTSDSFEFTSSGGLFDRDNDPNSGWPEK